MAWRLALAAAVLVAGVAMALLPPSSGRAADPAEIGKEADVRYSPDAVLEMMARDLATVSVDDTPHTRYISLRAGETAKERDDLARLVTATLHDLSRTRPLFPLVDLDPKVLVQPRAVVRVNSHLLRFQPRYFGRLFAEVWEQLGRQEPYWHGSDLTPTDGYEDVEYGHWELRGQYVEEGTRGARWVTVEIRRVKTDKKVISRRGWFLRTDGGKAAFRDVQMRMVDPRSGAYGTDVPVVDGDWLVGQVLVDADRDPGYHTFLGFDDLSSWKRLVGFIDDPKVLDEAFLTKLKAAMANGTVTGKDVIRRITEADKTAGEAWFTEDSNQRRADFDPKANPISNLGDDYRFQAIEALGHLANGFVAKGLFNNKGVRQDVAPDFIASDSTAPYADRRVHTGLCFRCHCAVKGASGFQPVKDWVRRMNRPPAFLAIKDPVLRAKVGEEYASEYLEPRLDASRQRYANALFRATGWRPEEYAEALDRLWKKHVEGPVTADMAARRYGVTREVFQDALTARKVGDALRARGASATEVAVAVAAATTKMDPMLAVYRPGPDEDDLPLVTFQQVYQRGADALYGVARPFDIRVKEQVERATMVREGDR